MKPTSNRARIRILAPGAARPYHELVYLTPADGETQIAVSARAEDLPTAISRLMFKLAELGLVVEFVPDGAPDPSPIPETSTNGQHPTGDTVSKLSTQRLRDIVIPDLQEPPAGVAPTERPRTAAPVTSRRRAKGGAR